MPAENGTARWPAGELERIGAAEEIGLASRRPDGSLRPYVTMWAVQAGDGLYVRASMEDPASIVRDGTFT